MYMHIPLWEWDDNVVCGESFVDLKTKFAFNRFNSESFGAPEVAVEHQT
jgi:hypothetical protein